MLCLFVSITAYLYPVHPFSYGAFEDNNEKGWNLVVYSKSINPITTYPQSTYLEIVLMKPTIGPILNSGFDR